MGVPRIVCLASVLGALQHSGYALINHLKDVPVDRFAEEEALEWCRAKRGEYLGPFGCETSLQCVEFGQRIKQRDVPSELVFEGRDAEPFDVEDVHVLATAEIEPHQFDRGVRGHREPPIPKRPFEERRRLLDFAGWQGQMGKQGSTSIHRILVATDKRRST